jgi:hypothetical protein
VAPVEAPHNLRSGDAHGRAVDDEGEGLVHQDGGGWRDHNYGGTWGTDNKLEYSKSLFSFLQYRYFIALFTVDLLRIYLLRK